MLNLTNDKKMKGVIKIIYSLTHKHICCESCYFEDRLEDALYGYVKAIETYDESKNCSFNSWVVWKVRSELLSRKKKCALRRSRELQAGQTDKGLKDPVDTSFWSRVTEELTEDATLVLQMIMDAPGEIMSLWFDAKDIKSMVRCYLSGRGLSMSKVTDAFSELDEFSEGLR